ncbi:hypothetical protein [Virgibacillus halodenitrificans]|uniref:Uncharacterized protein n=1 Tax=Virgibacillus halodenitrificans TaxID=1482 RepID=A0ABR7VNC4_VIRHA|nr:hypothetical protein [Virgibacillus halodenitrificans]MBD1222770.1 hypothetical protein [Virgibacillus halodenitrificans]
MNYDYEHRELVEALNEHTKAMKEVTKVLQYHTNAINDYRIYQNSKDEE